MINPHKTEPESLFHPLPSFFSFSPQFFTFTHVSHTSICRLFWQNFQSLIKGMCRVTMYFITQTRTPLVSWKWKRDGNNDPRTTGVSWNGPGQIVILWYIFNTPQSLSGGHFRKFCSVAWHYGNLCGRQSADFLDVLVLSYLACTQEVQHGEDHHLWLGRLCTAQRCHDEGRMGAEIQPAASSPSQVSRQACVCPKKGALVSNSHKGTT